MARVTGKWLAESLFPRVMDVARLAGVDTTGWSFGQIAGPSWMIAVKEGVRSGYRQIGLWATPADAKLGMEGMILAYMTVSEAAKR